MAFRRVLAQSRCFSGSGFADYYGYVALVLRDCYRATYFFQRSGFSDRNVKPV
jgi:hypothetical protein